jgi:DNA topoisomerase IB
MVRKQRHCARGPSRNVDRIPGEHLFAHLDENADGQAVQSTARLRHLRGHGAMAKPFRTAQFIVWPVAEVAAALARSVSRRKTTSSQLPQGDTGGGSASVHGCGRRTEKEAS